MTIKLSDYINGENRKLTPKQIRRFLIDYGFDDVEESIYMKTSDFFKMVKRFTNPDLERKAKAFDEVKKYTLNNHDEFEDRKDRARNPKEYDYFRTLQIANRAVINKCRQLEGKE